MKNGSWECTNQAASRLWSPASPRTPICLPAEPITQWSVVHFMRTCGQRLGQFAARMAQRSDTKKLCLMSATSLDAQLLKSCWACVRCERDRGGRVRKRIGGKDRLARERHKSILLALGSLTNNMLSLTQGHVKMKGETEWERKKDRQEGKQTQTERQRHTKLERQRREGETKNQAKKEKQGDRQRKGLAD